MSDSKELRTIVGEVRHLKRWDTAVPVVRMMDTMFAHADAFVELVAACERMAAGTMSGRDQGHGDECRCCDCEFRAALRAVRAVGRETA